MDTSKTYIKMCDCPEIQDAWEVSCGDWYMHWWEDTEWHLEIVGRDDEQNLGMIRANPSKERRVWLPRPDQLQGMYYTDYHKERYQTTKPRHLSIFIEQFSGTLYGDSCASMEQLWLAFVMKEKHNKIWNGEEWADE